MEKKAQKLNKIPEEVKMNMETTRIVIGPVANSSINNSNKQPLSSTKSIDEGFESDPDREQSTDSEQQQQQQQQSNGNNAQTVSSLCNTFDVVQLTDRDGMHHMQITRRPNAPSTAINVNTISQSHMHHVNHMQIDGRTSNVPKINPKVTIPRAVGGSSINQTVRSPTPLSHTSMQSVQFNTYRRSPLKGSTVMSLANGHEIKPPRSQSADTVRIRSSVVPTNPTAQRYMRSGSSSGVAANGGQYSTLSPVLHNSSSLYTFYPAEGNISLYPSQYGLRYKSSHLNVEEQAPITMWTQSIPRHSKR